MQDDHDEERVEDYNGPEYQDAKALDPSALRHALARLELFGDDPYLRVQASNLGIVDVFLTGVEEQVLRLNVEQERTPLAEASFLSAQSQMWMFAVYEALRTWRSRAKDALKLAANGGIPNKIAALERNPGYQHHARLMRADQLRRLLAEPDRLDALRLGLRRTHVGFGTLSALRIALAKHEVIGKPTSVAYAPGYGRINMYCGAIDFEISTDQGVLDVVNRRDIADGLRAIWTNPAPSDEDLASFDLFMKGPPQAGA